MQVVRTQISVLAALVSSVVGLACTSSQGNPSSVPSATARASPTPSDAIGALGTAGCRPVSPSGAFAAEVYGTASGGTVWAWFMQSFPPQAGVEDKTVWRLDGPGISAVPTFALVGPAGAQGRLDWGPDGHLGSSWDRPGDEYGTGLLFPVPGCWDVHVSVGKVTGDVYVIVVS